MSKSIFECTQSTETVRAFELMREDKKTNDVRYCFVKNSLQGVLPYSRVKIVDIDKEKYFEKALDCIQEIVADIDPKSIYFNK